MAWYPSDAFCASAVSCGRLCGNRKFDMKMASLLCAGGGEAVAWPSVLTSAHSVDTHMASPFRELLDGACVNISNLRTCAGRVHTFADCTNACVVCFCDPNAQHDGSVAVKAA